jgi:hypothetical protein
VGDNPLEPASEIIYPVVNRLDRIQIVDDNELDNDSSDVVGIISATFYWRDVLKKVLPNGKEGLVVVVENAASWASKPTIFTYQIK